MLPQPKARRVREALPCDGHGERIAGLETRAKVLEMQVADTIRVLQEISENQRICTKKVVLLIESQEKQVELLSGILAACRIGGDIRMLSGRWGPTLLFTTGVIAAIEFIRRILL
jgi:hypothetical protein